VVSGRSEARESGAGAVLYFEDIVRGGISTATRSVAACEQSADNLCQTVTEVKHWSVIVSDEEENHIGRNGRINARQLTVTGSSAGGVSDNIYRKTSVDEVGRSSAKVKVGDTGLPGTDGTTS
jgi:hypothetical protein